jgi:release factor glutamine methyltransferase
MTIREALSKGTAILKEANIEAPAAEAGVLLCHMLKKDKVYLFAYGEDGLEPVREEEYFRSIGQRVQSIPLQYITGHQEFMSLDFFVNPAVLIPRQDTEILVEAVLEHAKKLKDGTVEILDIGTGSGCIAISLAYYLSSAQVTAVDISKAALEVAGENAVKNRVLEKITFMESDVFDQIPEGKRFDVIVSNPPYIPAADISGLQPEVKHHEPRTALDGGQDGLDFYRRIADGAVEWLKPGGLLALEVGYDQAKAVSRLLESRYTGIGIVRDLSGIERVVTGRCTKK